MTNLIVLFVYCQLRLSMSIGELKTWKKNIETAFLKNMFLKILQPIILIYKKVKRNSNVFFSLLIFF